jgi:glycosyltransferase involved in cell wall biosynthesis
VDDPFIIDKGILWYWLKLPKLIKEYKLDVFWGPNFSLPPKVKGVKYYVTVHDLAIYKFKHIGQLRNELRIKMFLKHDLKKATKIFSVSNSTKSDIAEIMNIATDKIEVTYIAGNYDDGVCDEEIRIEIKNLDKYFLFVGTVEPRKNITTLVEAFEKYCAKYGDDTKLVIAGGKGWNCDKIYERINSSPVADKILLTGYVNGAEKEYLYKNAICFPYPSLYEGFGMPILEAFKYRLPVIAAYNSSLPEVGGDAAIYVNTYDSDGLCEKMYYISSLDDELMVQMQVKIDEQLALFSWEKCSEETITIITGGLQ